jgi:hypothetical protein
MLKRLAILGLLVLVYGACSQVPGNGSQQEKETQKQQQSSAKPNPPTPPAIHPENKGDNQAQGTSKEPPSYPWKELLVPANIPNWVLVIVAGLTGGVICWQSWELHEQTRHMMTKERARIDVSFPPEPLSLDDGPEWTEAMNAVYAGTRITVTNQSGVPPALPGRQSNFENSGSISRAVALAL